MIQVAPTKYPVMTAIAERWSTRLYDASYEMTEDERNSVLEAGRWAPSAFNTQPWRYIVGIRGGTTFEKIAKTMTEWNQMWAPSASMLVLTCAEHVGEDGRTRTHGDYDTGASMALMSIQAVSMGLVAHSMSGFDLDAARTAFGIDERLTPISITAFGKYAPNRTDIDNAVIEKDAAPRVRKEMADLILAAD